MSVISPPPTVRSFHIFRPARKSTKKMTCVRMSIIRSNNVEANAEQVLTKLQQDCATPLPVLRHVAGSMAADMRAGLATEGGSDLPMILSYVDTLLNGNEKVLFYALDLGGTNFRVIRVQLDVCDTIAKRGGVWLGQESFGILQKMEEDSRGLVFSKRTVVATDGGLYEYYPQYRRHLQDAVDELLGPDISKTIVIEHTKGGSGIGAALLAAANSKYDHEW